MVLLSDNLAILLERAHEALLLLDRLEATVAHLRGGVDELEVDVLHGGTARLLQQGLAKGDGTLLGAHNATLKVCKLEHVLLLNKALTLIRTKSFLTKP